MHYPEPPFKTEAAGSVGCWRLSVTFLSRNCHLLKGCHLLCPKLHSLPGSACIQGLVSVRYKGEHLCRTTQLQNPCGISWGLCGGSIAAQLLPIPVAFSPLQMWLQEHPPVSLLQEIFLFISEAIAPGEPDLTILGLKILERMAHSLEQGP